MIYGYARVSTQDQDLSLQESALRAAGCAELVTEHASGAKRERPALEGLLARVQRGDVVVVWKLDRLSRSLVDLLWILGRIEAAGAGFRCVTEPVDTTTPAGRMMMQMLGAFAEFERAMIRERTQAGVDAARRRGARLGRRPALTSEQRSLALDLLAQGKTQGQVAGLLGVSQTTISRLHSATLRSQEGSPFPPRVSEPNAPR